MMAAREREGMVFVALINLGVVTRRSCWHGEDREKKNKRINKISFFRIFNKEQQNDDVPHVLTVN